MNLWEFEFYTDNDGESEESTEHVIASTLYEAIVYFYSHHPGHEPARIINIGAVITGEKE